MGTWDERMRPRPVERPQSEFLERCWRLKTSTGRVLTCGIFKDAHGLEVRGGCEPREFLFSQRAAEIGDARAIAEQQRLAMVEEFGPLEALPHPTPGDHGP